MTADNLLPLVARFLNGEPVAFWDDEDPDEIDKKLLPFAVLLSPEGRLRRSLFDDAPKGSVAIIPVKGTIMKEDFCGSPGTATMKEWTKQADANPNIVGGILHIDSGGGAVDGTSDFADVVAGTQKPWLAFADGTMASAAYEIAAPANEIWANNKDAIIGSIGTMMTLRDNRKALEAYGYKSHVINADSSPDKNKDYFDALDGKYEGMKQNLLNPLNGFFLDSVKKHRAGKLDLKKEDVLTGKVYVGQAAMDHGLVDRIGTLEQAVERVTELAAESSDNNHKDDFQQTYNTMKNTKLWALLAALHIVKPVAEADQDKAVITDDNIDALKVKVDENQQALNTANARVTELEGQLATSEQKVKDLTAEVERLGTQPGEKPTTVKKEGTDKIENAGDGIYDPTAEHNQAAEAMLKK